MLEETYVVTCFLQFQSRILILRRSEKVSTYQGRWAGISGYMERRPDEQALTEIEEETGLSKEDVKLVRRGEPLEVIDAEVGKRWVIHPYLFQITDPSKVKIDWEHKEYKWIDPEDIGKYETVPNLRETWERVC